jgi:predicted dehydrogenase
MGEMRFGVVGLGFGEQHVRTLANLPGVRLVAVADTVRERVDRISARYGVRGFQDAAAMMDAGGLDAVSLCVSPAYREPLLRLAASWRLPLFVEKPWSSTVKQGLAFRRLLGDLPVMVGFSFRFHPVVRRLLDLLHGELGPACVANGEYAFRFLPPAGHWLWDPGNGNGLFNENSCHLFDVACALVGEPVSVMAAGRSYAGSPSEDGAAVTVAFRSGAVAALSIGGLGSAAFKSFPRLDLMTEKGQAWLSGREHIWERLTWALRGEEAVKTLELPAESLGTTRYTRAFEHFLKAIADGSRPEATIDDGIRCVAMAEAVYRSIREGRRVELAELWDGGS